MEVIAVLDNEAVIKIHHDYASIDFLIKESLKHELKLLTWEKNLPLAVAHHRGHFWTHY